MPHMRFKSCEIHAGPVIECHPLLGSHSASDGVSGPALFRLFRVFGGGGIPTKLARGDTGTYGCADATRVALAQTGFFKMAAAVAVAPELLTDFYTLPAHALTVAPEDLELKRLAWAATAALCATDDNRVQVRLVRLIPGPSPLSVCRSSQTSPSSSFFMRRRDLRIGLECHTLVHRVGISLSWTGFRFTSAAHSHECSHTSALTELQPTHHQLATNDASEGADSDDE